MGHRVRTSVSALRASPGFLWAFSSALGLLLSPALYTLTGGVAFGAPHPCTRAPAPLPQLQRRLSRSERSGDWRAVAQQAEEAEEILRSEQAPRGALRCAAGLAAEAYFFLSAEREERALHSARGISAGLRLLSYLNAPPEAQLLERFRLLWRRLREAQGDAQWLEAGAPRWIRIPRRERPLRLWIAPPQQTLWRSICGASLRCRAPLTFSLVLPAGDSLKLPLSPGTYQLRWGGPCVDVAERWTLAAGDRRGAPELGLELPDQRCTSRLQVYDYQGPVEGAQLTTLEGSPLDERALFEGSSVRVSAPGYQPEEVVVPSEGRPLSIELRRCAGHITPQLEPADAVLTGGARLIWGAVNRVRVARAGYVPWEGTITPPRPDRCPPPPTPLSVKLRRALTVNLISQETTPVETTESLLDGFPVDLQKIERPPGRYQLSVELDGRGQLLTELEIPPCERTRCLPLSHDLTLPPPREFALAPSLHIAYAGVAISTLGLLYGAKQWHGQTVYRALESSTERSALRSQIQRERVAAFSLTFGGLLLSTLGFTFSSLGP